MISEKATSKKLNRQINWQTNYYTKCEAQIDFVKIGVIKLPAIEKILYWENYNR
jgi:hypothetical protein